MTKRLYDEKMPIDKIKEEILKTFKQIDPSGVTDQAKNSAFWADITRGMQ